MSARRYRELVVKKKTLLTPNMIRIILGGDDLHDFPEGQESAYVKLVFAANKGATKPTTRSYTIRAFDKETLTLTLDFVAHGDNGPASAWALGVSEGECIAIDGPGPTKLVDTSADWFFLAGDMTALPAISVNLEKLPQDAKGYVVLEVLSDADKQDLIVPKNMNVHWLINPSPDQPNTLLPDAVKALPWLEGEPNVWVASEFDSMRRLRTYFKKERGVGRGQVYASSYWKMGETDEGNKAAKKRDVEA
ncbi:MAG: siderophore-interacting protein [Cellvibrionaceae bacterium]